MEVNCPVTSAQVIVILFYLTQYQCIFLVFKSAVWKGQNGWGLEKKKVGFRNAGSAAQRTKQRETCAPLGGEAKQSHASAINSAVRQERVNHHQ